MTKTLDELLAEVDSRYKHSGMTEIILRLNPPVLL